MMLSPEELAVVESLSMPIAYDQRAAFIAVVAEAMANQKVRGPGAVHRIASAVQLTFVRTSTTVTNEQRHAAEALSRGTRHAATPAGIVYAGKGAVRHRLV